jgi:hypothetical protein
MKKVLALVILVFLGVLSYAYISREPYPVPVASPPAPQPQTPKVKASPQPEEKPVVSSEVAELALILNLNELGDGSVIEFHVSESFGESFTITVEKGSISVKKGGAASKDLTIWVSRKAFYEILYSQNPVETIKKKIGTGEMSVTREASVVTLYRKGYKRLASSLGLL